MLKGTLLNAVTNLSLSFLLNVVCSISSAVIAAFIRIGFARKFLIGLGYLNLIIVRGEVILFGTAFILFVSSTKIPTVYT